MKLDEQVKALSPEARALHARLTKEWGITDAAGTLTLLTALQSLDRMRQAQALIAKDGILQNDRFGTARPHPATQVEKESRAGLLQALKALSLDFESLESEE